MGYLMLWFGEHIKGIDYRQITLRYSQVNVRVKLINLSFYIYNEEISRY